ncbi:heterokaryon incompatibility protein [Diplodia corticola]|uniref:Heterokaryon incompatibility protein n=1 Tax=Diplodia corticola TaxID=236234 RepID=A0A1J9RBH1_9PEZI|nr:heterokaryon incompatibility protein [Diplodia corticola]OJD37904.1 heterokaryon incompatibility protein [Diplodia corticola]
MSAENPYPEIQHLCAPCAGLNFREILLHDLTMPDDAFPYVRHHKGVEELVTCAIQEGCELCRIFMVSFASEQSFIYGTIRPEEDCEERVRDILEKQPHLRERVLIAGPYSGFPVPGALFSEGGESAGIGLWISTDQFDNGDENVKEDMDKQNEEEYQESDEQKAPSLGRIGKTPITFAKFSSERSTTLGDMPLVQNIRLRPISNDPKTPACMRTASEWLTNCLQNHNQCRKDTPAHSQLPTRVLDVGDETQEPRLVVTGDSVGNYAALSYCWGVDKNKHLTLTEDNLEVFRISIPLSSLPKTLLDAVLVTRSLGLQYLWIDALCIIQDSAEDWTYEAGSMNAVYNNAIVAIFATSAKSADDGFLERRVPDPYRYHLPRSAVWPTNTNLDRDLTETEANPIFLELFDEKPLYLDEDMREDDTYPWKTRGWTLQERLSPKRGISFNKTQMMWHCLTCTEQECGHHEDYNVRRQFDLVDHISAVEGSLLLTSISERWDTLVRLSESVLAVTGVERYEELAVQLWFRILDHYSTRTLSDHSDRLPAVAALAKTLEDRMGGRNRYLAGLWENEIALGLAWTPCGNEIAQWCKNEAAIRAPSWSWASVAASSYNGYRCHEFDKWNIRSVMNLEGIEIANDEERFLPRSTFALRIRAPAKRLSDSWASTENTTDVDEQDLAQATLERILRRRLVPNRQGSSDDIIKEPRSSEYVQKHEPHVGQRFLAMKYLERTGIGGVHFFYRPGPIESFFLILESVSDGENRYRRVADVMLADQAWSDEGVVEKDLLDKIKEQRWPRQEIELV